MASDELMPLSQPDLSPRVDEPELETHGEPALAFATSMNRLAGKVALIAGGDHGIGRAVAIALARDGADVAILYLDHHEGAQETMRRVVEAGRQTMALSGDVGVSKFCDDAVSEVITRFGRIDVLVNAASERHEQHEFSQLEDARIERTFRTNILGQIFLSRAVLPHLQNGAAIVNTSSATAFEGHKSMIDDAASQGAVIAFTRSLALALEPRGIRVNAVAPSPACPAEDIAPSYAFLAGGESRSMTGQVLQPNITSLPNG